MVDCELADWTVSRWTVYWIDWGASVMVDCELADCAVWALTVDGL